MSYAYRTPAGSSSQAYQPSARSVEKLMPFARPFNVEALSDPLAERARRALDDIARLEDDWDGYGAVPISVQARYAARDAVRDFAGAGLIPDVSPNPSGTVSLEWEGAYAFAHLEIGKTRFSMYIEPDDGEVLYFAGHNGASFASAIDALRRARNPGVRFGAAMNKVRF